MGNIESFFLWKKKQNREQHLLDIHDNKGNYIEIYLDDEALGMLREAIE